MMKLAYLLLSLPGVLGHGALSFPRPRNAIDGTLPDWKDWQYPCDATHTGAQCAINFCEDAKDCQGGCPISAHSGVAGELNASNGQSCYWFSNGCTIGCGACDGTSNHVGHGHQKFLYKGMNSAEVKAKGLTVPFNPPAGDLVLDPSTVHTLNASSLCGDERTTNATVHAPALRTANTQAASGSAEDFYRFSPWRAPGSAPVVDACGSAGGRLPGQGTGPAGAQYEATVHAKEGDVGSGLPQQPSGATWKIGGLAEVGWTIMANHGGGYAYRLAPADGPLTEEAFRKTPLDMVGEAFLRWDGDVKTQIAYDAFERGWETTSSGTTPPFSMWRKNPIPSGLWEREGPMFDPVCEESKECLASFSGGTAKAGICRCSGFSNGGPLLPNVEIVDNLRIPADLEPGPYVLQWRWDCEESDQVWSSCADVTILP